MRVLQLNTYADRVGGAEAYLYALTDALRERGHEVALFGTSAEREIDEAELRVVRRTPFDPAKLLEDAPVRRAFEQLAARFRPEVIHVHNLHDLGLDLVQTLGAAGTPLVQTVHDYAFLCPNSWCVHGDGTPCPGGAGAKCFEHDCETNAPVPPLHALVTKLRCEQAKHLIDVAISPSTHLASMLTAHGFRDVRHLHNFVEADPPTAVERGAPALLFLGRLTAEKGVAVLLDAMARIVREEPEATLRIVGKGPALPALRRRVKELALGAAVRFEGQVPHERVRDYLGTSRTLIVPSIWSENSPLTIHESLGAGLPVIASRIGGIPDLVIEGETGFLFEPRNAEELADKVLHLLRLPEPERARIAAACEEHIRPLTRAANVDGVEAIYRELLTRGSTRAPAPSLDGDADLEELQRRVDEDRKRRARSRSPLAPLVDVLREARRRLRDLVIRRGWIER